MDFKHKNHLVSSYHTLQKQIQEIRNTICEGRPPTKANASLTPLTKGVQDAMTTRLEKIDKLFEQLTQLFAGAELKKIKTKEPVSATKMWASIQLRQLQECVSDIHPKVFERKFGALDPEEKLQLEKTIDQINQELEETKKLV